MSHPSSLLCARNSLGETPAARLNAEEKLDVSVYPNSRAIVLIGVDESASNIFALSILLCLTSSV